MGTGSSQRYTKQSAPPTPVPPAPKKPSYVQSSQSGPKPGTDAAVYESQNSRRRPRDEEQEEEDDMSDSEVTANVIAERRASGKKGRPKAVPGERNKSVRLSKNGLGGAEVYESLMTLVCAELVRRRLSLKGCQLTVRKITPTAQIEMIKPVLVEAGMYNPKVLKAAISSVKDWISNKSYLLRKKFLLLGIPFCFNEDKH